MDNYLLVSLLFTVIYIVYILITYIYIHIIYRWSNDFSYLDITILEPHCSVWFSIGQAKSAVLEVANARPRCSLQRVVPEQLPEVMAAGRDAAERGAGGMLMG